MRIHVLALKKFMMLLHTVSSQQFSIIWYYRPAKKKLKILVGWRFSPNRKWFSSRWARHPKRLLLIERDGFRQSAIIVVQYTIGLNQFWRSIHFYYDNAHFETSNSLTIPPSPGLTWIKCMYISLDNTRFQRTIAQVMEHQIFIKATSS